jgi:hypothetical protein
MYCPVSFPPVSPVSSSLHTHFVEQSLGATLHPFNLRTRLVGGAYRVYCIHTYLFEVNSPGEIQVEEGARKTISTGKSSLGQARQKVPKPAIPRPYEVYDLDNTGIRKVFFFEKKPSRSE